MTSALFGQKMTLVTAVKGGIAFDSDSRLPALLRKSGTAMLFFLFDSFLRSEQTILRRRESSQRRYIPQ